MMKVYFIGVGLGDFELLIFKVQWLIFECFVCFYVGLLVFEQVVVCVFVDVLVMDIVLMMFDEMYV